MEVLCAPVREAIRAGVEAGALAYFELAARECVGAFFGLGCGVGLDHDLLAIKACRDMLSPEGDENEPCALALACKSGLRCAVTDACPGKCRPLRSNNETCAPSDPCGPDLFCAAAGTRCRGRVALDAICELSVAGNSCREGFCDGSQPGDPICRPPRGRGAGCRSSFECTAGARCLLNRCSLGLEGDTCAETVDCDRALRCAGGACRTPLPLDEACGAASSPCDEGLACTSTQGEMRCRPRALLGTSCTDVACYLARCEDGTCAPAVRDGEACGEDPDCFPDRACAEGRCQAARLACAE